MALFTIMSIKQQYEQAGQGQVFQFWSSLSSEQQKSLTKQLEVINPSEISEISQQAEHEGKNIGSIEPLPANATASMLDSDPKDIAKWRQQGLDEIKAGKVAVLLLAGGQGTRLGSSAPKGCYDIGLPSHKSLFQLQAERILKIAELAGGKDTSIPWYIMTSGPTRGPTEEFFEKHNYFGVPKQDVVFFEQGTLPCLTKDGKIILESADKVSVAPDGNGGVYKALDKGGVLSDLKKRGIKHVHMYCVDNSLVKVADPVFIGFASSRNAQVATKVVRKRDASESVGLIVAKDGKPGVIEYSEISKELAEAKDDEHPDLLKLRAANIVNHYYSTDFLLESPTLAKKLPYHVAHKKIPYAGEDGKTVKPSSSNGIKLEQFVFDIFPQVPLDKFVSLEVGRNDEFSPVKNGPGSGEDCPETARDDLMHEGQRWLNDAGAVTNGPVEVAASISYGGEGLERYKGDKITEDFLH